MWCTGTCQDMPWTKPDLRLKLFLCFIYAYHLIVHHVTGELRGIYKTLLHQFCVRFPEMSIHRSLQHWHFTQVGGGEGTKDGEWLRVSEFPTTVHVELLRLKKIPDPVGTVLPWISPQYWNISSLLGSMSGMYNVCAMLFLSLLPSALTFCLPFRGRRKRVGVQVPFWCDWGRAWVSQCRSCVWRSGHFCQGWRGQIHSRLSSWAWLTAVQNGNRILQWVIMHIRRLHADLNVHHSGHLISSSHTEFLWRSCWKLVPTNWFCILRVHSSRFKAYLSKKYMF